MNQENKQSYDSDIEQAINIAQSSKDTADGAQIIPFPAERVATAAPVTVSERNPFPSDTESAQEVTPSISERSGITKRLLAIGSAAAVAALAFLPRADHAPAPQPDTFGEQVQQSAEVPYDPATDKLVVDGITVQPGIASQNTPSEAVLSNPDVHEYVASNPDESTSLTTSSLSLPSAETYAVVERDVDGDGDTDAVAVPSNK